MATLLPDHNIKGHFEVLLRIWTSPSLWDFWEGLSLSAESFESLGIPESLPDSELWQLCQERELILLTGNRNEDGANSLEATIAAHNGPTSLPVFTISAPDQVMVDRFYAERVAEKVIDYVSDLEKIRGTGRLFVP
jgi:hypothetical protein